MADDALHTILGITGESVMALYGIARLLQARELGPAQLRPALESYRSDAASLVGHLDEAFATLSQAMRDAPELSDALGALKPFAMEAARSIAETFGRSGHHRLGARERLELEQQAEQLGGELESIRTQLELLRAALLARPVDLALADLAKGRWRSRPTFVAREVAVRWDLRQDGSFTIDPRVLWALLEAAFRQLSVNGDGSLLVRGRVEKTGQVRAEVRLSPLPAGTKACGDDLRLGLSAPLPVEAAISGAVARHFDIELEQDGADAVTIAL